MKNASAFVAAVTAAVLIVVYSPTLSQYCSPGAVHAEEGQAEKPEWLVAAVEFHTAWHAYGEDPTGGRRSSASRAFGRVMRALPTEVAVQRAAGSLSKSERLALVSAYAKDLRAAATDTHLLSEFAVEELAAFLAAMSDWDVGGSGAAATRAAMRRGLLQELRFRAREFDDMSISALETVLDAHEWDFCAEWSRWPREWSTVDSSALGGPTSEHLGSWLANLAKPENVEVSDEKSKALCQRDLNTAALEVANEAHRRVQRRVIQVQLAALDEDWDGSGDAGQMLAEVAGVDRVEVVATEARTTVLEVHFDQQLVDRCSRFLPPSSIWIVQWSYER